MAEVAQSEIDQNPRDAHCVETKSRLRVAYSGYSSNPKVVSGLRCARITTRVIQLNSEDRDHGDKPLSK